MKKKIVMFACMTVLFFMAYSIYNMILTKAQTVGVLQGTYDNLSDETNNIDYIKILYKDGSYEEHWRDSSNFLERTDKYDENGNFVNRILVLDNGTRVINIGLENGKFKAYSWKMPNKIAAQNSEILKGSILKDVKESLKTKKWTLNGKVRNNTGAIVQKFSVSEDPNIQRYSSDNTDIYVDKNSNIIKRMEVYENNELKRVEEYSKFKDTSKELFKVNNKINKCEKEIDVPIKEIKAPVDSEDSVG